ncbi:MAG: 2-oxo acid dehydrogenase subunit E2, partial [candidate division Zixibacteria bacterium]|nr:2-oxo acid dehydrogenase subunit E2 [candidate division Zixibacteria bacterium]
QVGVLAVGAASRTPVVRGGEIVVRQIMPATLSTDHRAAHGAEAAQFVGEIKRVLEDPQTLDA